MKLIDVVNFLFYQEFYQNDGIFIYFNVRNIAKLIMLRTCSFLAENTKSSRESEHGDGVNKSAERVGRIHDDEGTQFGGRARRSGS